MADYRINQAWADANLKNPDGTHKGWNGSPIVAWAIYTASVIVDITVPVITVPQLTYTITQGDAFTPPNGLATDNIDADVVITPVGTIDVNTLDDYLFTYDHIDAAGNVATQVVVTVTVEAAVVSPPLDATFTSVNTSDSTMDGVVRLSGAFASVNASDATLDGIARLSSGFTSDVSSDSALDGVVRLSATFTSDNTSQSSFSFDASVPEGGFTSTNTSDSSLDGHVRLSAGFVSSIASDSSADGFVRLTAGFESNAVSESVVDGVVRFDAGFESNVVSNSVFDGVTRLTAGFASVNVSFGLFSGVVEGAINGLVNPSEPPIYIELNRPTIDVNLVRPTYSINLEG